MVGVYLKLNMGYFGEWNYINEAASLLLDLCCLSLSIRVKLSYFYCCVLIARYIVYESSSQKPAKIGGSSEPLEPPLVTGLYAHILDTIHIIDKILNSQNQIKLYV